MGDQNENQNLNLDQLEASILCSCGAGASSRSSSYYNISKEDAYYICEEFKGYEYGWLVSTLLLLLSSHTTAGSPVKLFALGVLSESLGDRPGANSSLIKISGEERIYLKDVFMNIIALSIENDRKFEVLQNSSVDSSGNQSGSGNRNVNVNENGNDGHSSSTIEETNAQLAVIENTIEELILKISNFFHEFAGGNKQLSSYISNLHQNLTFSSSLATNEDYFSLSKQPTFISNKFVYCMVLLVNLDYPSSWENPFEEFMMLVQNAGSPSIYFYYNLFFRFMSALNDELISRSAIDGIPNRLATTTTLKDHLRNTGTVAAICDLTYDTILHTYEQNHVDLCKFALKILSQLIEWADLRLLVNETYLEVYYTLLRHTCVGPQAAQCILSLVKKGMTLNHKVLFLSKINLFEVLQSLPPIDTYLSSTTDENHTLIQSTTLETARNYTIFGELIDAVGCVLIKAWLFNLDLVMTLQNNIPSLSQQSQQSQHSQHTQQPQEYTDLILLYYTYGESALIGAGSNNENMPLDAITMLIEILNIENKEELTPLNIYYLVTEYLHIYSKLMLDVFVLNDPQMVKACLESLQMLVAEILPKQEHFYSLLTKDKNKSSTSIGDISENKECDLLLRFNVKDYLSTLFWCLLKEMKYPLDFQFDVEDEDENLVEEYKEEIRKLITTMTRVAPHTTLDLIREYWTQLFEYLNESNKSQEMMKNSKMQDQNNLLVGKSMNASDVEVGLRLIWLYGTAVPGQNALEDPKFTELLDIIYNCPSFYCKKAHSNPCEHFSVLLQFYEVGFRYLSYLRNNQTVITPILEAMIGAPGLLHPSSSVLRSRVAYILPRILKSLKDCISDIESLALSIAEILSNPVYKEIITKDIEEYLFECIGIVASLPANDPMLSRNLVASVLEEHVAVLNAACSNGLESPSCGQICSALRFISRACTTGKSSGYSNSSQSKSSQNRNTLLPLTYLREYFVEIFNLVNAALFTNDIDFTDYISGTVNTPNNFNFLYIADSQIRAKYLTLIHRTVALVGEDLLPSLQNPLAGVLLFLDETKETVEYVTLINNLMIKYKRAFLPILEVVFVPLCAKLLLYTIPSQENQLYELDQQSQVVEILKTLIPNKKDNSIYTPISNSAQQSTGPTNGDALVATHVEAEKSGLLKSYLHFLNHIILNENAAVLLTDNTRNLLIPFFSALVDLAVNATDSSLRKSSFAILASFLPAISEEETVRSNIDFGEQLVDYYYKEVLPVAMTYPFMSCFDLKDAETLSILLEISNLLSNVYRCQGNELTNYLSEILLPILQNTVSESISANKAYLDTVSNIEANSFISEKQKLAIEIVATIIDLLTTGDFKTPKSQSTRALQKSLLALSKAVQSV